MTKKEISVLKTILSEYASIDEKMRANESALKKIAAEQSELMQKLEKTEEKEKNFMNAISSKYPGMTIVDLLKFID